MTLAPLVSAVLTREATLAAAQFRARPVTIPSPTPGRPAWWDLMSVEMRALAEAAIEAGVWRVPG